MEVTTGRKLTDHPQPPQQWLSVFVASSSSYFSYRNGFWGMYYFISSFAQRFYSAIPVLRIPLSMATQNAIV